ncbi:MAG: ABC transporter permease [Planctomycetota bacterium]
MTSKLSIARIAAKSFRFYLRSNLALALGVAAATAVLIGALVVGDSMRTSLRNLALDRLGKIDELLVSDGFFGRELVERLKETESFKSAYSMAAPGILFPNGTTEWQAEQGYQRVGKVNVFGITNDFWEFGDSSFQDLPLLKGRVIIVNQNLADQLSASIGDELTLRIPKPSLLPSDSALGKKKDLVESLVELEIVAIIPNQSLGRFGLHVSQVDSPNLFASIDLLEESLSRTALKGKMAPQANVVFLSGKQGFPPDQSISDSLLGSVRPALADFGIAINQVTQTRADSDQYVFRYFGLSSDRLVLSDALAEQIQSTFPDAKPVFTYLANDICLESQPSGIPFSMVSAIDFDDDFQLLDTNDQRIPPLGDYEIVLNEWAAENINAKVGSSLKLTYFEPEATHGSGTEQESHFEVKAIAKLAYPDKPFVVRRRKVTPAQFFEQSPTLANDPDLTPVVTGLTDAESIENWDLPFETADSLRPEDDDYWQDFRTTPKAFVSLKRGQQLWQSRFGQLTSFRIPISYGNDVAAIQDKLLAKLHQQSSPSGFTLVPIKRQAILASSGSTPFDVLFLALSMFVIVSALILVSLLLRLNLQRRTGEIGIMLASGLESRVVAKTMIYEMAVATLVGVVMGIVLGIGYAWLMIFGLSTWWLGAISEPILVLHLSPVSMITGALCGLLICFLTVIYTIRQTRKNSIRQLLTGHLESESRIRDSRSKWKRRIIFLLLISAVSLSVVASFLGGEPQAGAFMASGFLVLTAGLMIVDQYLKRERKQARTLDLRQLAKLSGSRNPLRSTLTVGLVAVASFLIVAVSSFRLTPTVEGTAGFDLIASSDQPIFDNLDEEFDLGIESFSLRVKSGEDASCTNLYQSSQPGVLGVSEKFIQSFEDSREKFRFAASTATRIDQKENPWLMLNEKFESDGEELIPVIIDKNTANYSLKIFATGADYSVQFDSGESVRFRVVGFLENTILQGSLIVSEENFEKLFPYVSGYRKFLIRTGGNDLATSEVSADLEEQLSDSGFDAKFAADVLADYQQVQNTYISTFQTLGALGLLLGTFGLAIVQLRNILDRQSELALMQAVGFARSQLSRLVLLENVWLLMIGLLVGVIAALVTTFPHFIFGGASIPWLELSILFSIIALVGILAAYLASRSISRIPLLESLRV